MGVPKIWITVALVSCSLSAAVFASADTMTIVYRSGKTQTIVMDEPSQEVKSITYLETSGALPESTVKGATVRPAGTGQGSKEPAPEAKKPGVSIKWAAPIEE
jgi:hypothetical protein